MVGALAPLGPLEPFVKEAWLTGVMGVEGVGVAGGSTSDDEGALAVEFFLFGRYRHVSNITTRLSILSKLAFLPSFLSFLLLGFALFDCDGVGGA